METGSNYVFEVGDPLILPSNSLFSVRYYLYLYCIMLIYRNIKSCIFISVQNLLWRDGLDVTMCLRWVILWFCSLTVCLSSLFSRPCMSSCEWRLTNSPRIASSSVVTCALQAVFSTHREITLAVNIHIWLYIVAILFYILRFSQTKN